MTFRNYLLVVKLKLTIEETNKNITFFRGYLFWVNIVDFALLTKKVVCVFIRFRRHTSMIGEIQWNTPETKSVFWIELIVVYRHNTFELSVYGKLLRNTDAKLC